jgi:dihydroxyacetone kinase-like protein
MQTAFILKAIEAVHQAILANEAQIESLDREIGDGDHYINMKRGCATIANMLEELEILSPDAAINKIGIKLLSTIGGASGPLFASFFISMGKTLKENGDGDPAHIAAAFAAGVQAIMQRGKADVGEKTMLDVLIPVSHKFTTLAVQNTEINILASAIKAEAETGMLATKHMIATKGRAAGLGERTIGHIDAGAKSCQVMIEAVCNLL